MRIKLHILDYLSHDPVTLLAVSDTRSKKETTSRTIEEADLMVIFGPDAPEALAAPEVVYCDMEALIPGIFGHGHNKDISR